MSDNSILDRWRASVAHGGLSHAKQRALIDVARAAFNNDHNETTPELRAALEALRALDFKVGPK